MKILTIVGARPQFIKAAVVSRQLQLKTGVEEVLVHTGQHHDFNMSELFFREMQIPLPKYNLGIAGGRHGAMTGRMLEHCERVMLEERPECVLVYGDTNSTLAGGLAAAKLKIPLAHVEAGLRSFNRRMPEEINRIVTDQLSDILFVPTLNAQGNLMREGVPEHRIQMVGDVMLDATLHFSSLAPESRDIERRFGHDFALVTLHRAENTDDAARFDGIAAALRAIAREMPVIFAVHPRTRAKLLERDTDLGGVTTIDPVGYLEMLAIIKSARIVLTDSGGLQKEAYFLRRPCVTLRDETEWVELVEVGWNMLSGADTQRIIQATQKMLDELPVAHPPLYGDGMASTRIAGVLCD